MECLGRRACCWRLVWPLAVMASAGCQLTPAPGLVACPLPANEQVAAVLQVTPLGTHRDDVARRLKAAGIFGNFGENQAVFYCDAWQRSESERWHINVALLFDEHGRLYATRPSTDAAENEPPGRQRMIPAERDPFE